MSDLRAVFAPVAEVAGDAPTTQRVAYAICRETRGIACACEWQRAEPCPRLLLAAIAVEKLLMGEGQ